METRRLVGRPVGEGDIPFLLRTWNDERVAALVGESMSEEQVRERIDRWARHAPGSGCGTELFSERSTGQPIGWGGLQRSTIGIGERLTIGYAITPDRWGSGFATEVARASVACAFGSVGVDEVRASILSTNAPSRRVAEKAGLSLECEVPHGALVEVIYVIRREEWNA